MGLTSTKTWVVAVLLQPLLAVPVAEYVVLTVGLTTTLFEVEVTGAQEKVLAPLALIVVVLPLQITGEIAETVTVGVGTTFIDTVLVPTQPVTYDLPATV